MVYGIDISEEEIRWVGSPDDEGKYRCGRVPIEGESPDPSQAKQLLSGLFSRLKVRRFVYPISGVNVRAKLFASDKVDISELEDNVSWEAQYVLAYDRRRDVLSFDPLRSVGKDTWIVGVAAPLDEIKKKTSVLPSAPLHIETCLTALANAVLESRWGQTDLMTLHLDVKRAFLVIISHGNPLLMQEIPYVNQPDGVLDSAALSMWQEELKLRRNFLPRDNRKLDYFLLSGQAGLVEENAKALGNRLGLPGEVFNPFEGKEVAGEALPLYTLAYACCLRGEA